MRECEGYDLVILDSLRAGAPSVEENDSKVRRVLDVTTRVSEVHECVFIVIHHARKPNGSSAGGAKMAIRGSGALFDACESVFVFEADKGKPTRVTHEKARTTGIPADDFELVIEDVEEQDDPRSGLRVSACSVQKSTGNTASEKFETCCEEVLQVITEYPRKSKRFVRAHVEGFGNDRIDAGLEELESRGLIRNEGDCNGAQYEAVEEDGS